MYKKYLFWQSRKTRAIIRFRMWIRLSTRIHIRFRIQIHFANRKRSECECEQLSSEVLRRTLCHEKLNMHFNCSSRAVARQTNLYKHTKTNTLTEREREREGERGGGERGEGVKESGKQTGTVLEIDRSDWHSSGAQKFCVWFIEGFVTLTESIHSSGV